MQSGRAGVLPTVSFVSEIFAGDCYTDDGIRFATQAEALAYGETRAYVAYRATPSDEPVNYRWTEGRLAQAESAYVPLYAKK
jgi:hypothetical protein